MKYIKLFEDLNEDGYEEISYSSSRKGEAIPPSQGDREFEILSKMGFIKQLWLKDSMDSIEYYYLGINLSGERRGIYIHKYDDEWYEVLVNTMVNGARRPNAVYKSYRCDQLDGLLACLKKEFNIS